jgi:hypothetical protein
MCWERDSLSRRERGEKQITIKYITRIRLALVVVSCGADHGVSGSPCYLGREVPLGMMIRSNKKMNKKMKDERHS